jgi:hypothetical protein
MALSACGLTAPRSSDGYADLETLGMRDTDRVMSPSIGPALLHFVDEQIQGMTVLVSDGESEAVVINLMGEIRPQQFSDVIVALDVDTPGVENVQLADVEES